MLPVGPSPTIVPDPGKTSPGTTPPDAPPSPKLQEVTKLTPSDTVTPYKTKPSDIEALQNALGYHFIRRDLLDLALTHTSWANERGTVQDHNERLEFLGDAVLQLAVTDELYHRYPEVREGMLTARRSGIVCETCLSAVAREIGLDKCLKLGWGEETSGARQRDSTLSDAMEAVLAAVYEDGGYSAARLVVGHVFRSRFDGPVDYTRRNRDNKTRLQEVCQRIYRVTPQYRKLPPFGEEHAPSFVSVLLLPDGRRFRGEGTSHKTAEQQAAGFALEAMLAAGDMAAEEISEMAEAAARREAETRALAGKES
jgi:ribonuclease-3